ncbi:MAG: hypothetical protein ACI90V_007046, partial [Bacillariaceae sp.]
VQLASSPLEENTYYYYRIIILQDYFLLQEVRIITLGSMFFE